MKPTTELVLYDAARRALADAKAVDEVLEINNRAIALKAYARQAKDKSLEQDAAEIRLRAERRLGEMMAAQKETVGLAKPGGDMRPEHRVTRKPDAPPTLASAGIDKHLADRARKAAAIPEEKFEAAVEQARADVIAPLGHTPAASARTIPPAEEDGVDDRQGQSLTAAWEQASPDARQQFLDQIASKLITPITVVNAIRQWDADQRRKLLWALCGQRWGEEMLRGLQKLPSGADRPAEAANPEPAPAPVSGNGADQPTSTRSNGQQSCSARPALRVCLGRRCTPRPAFTARRWRKAWRKASFASSAASITWWGDSRRCCGECYFLGERGNPCWWIRSSSIQSG